MAFPCGSARTGAFERPRAAMSRYACWLSPINVRVLNLLMVVRLPTDRTGFRPSLGQGARTGRSRDLIPLNRLLPEAFG